MQHLVVPCLSLMPAPWKQGPTKETKCTTKLVCQANTFFELFWPRLPRTLVRSCEESRAALHFKLVVCSCRSWKGQRPLRFFTSTDSKRTSETQRSFASLTRRKGVLQEYEEARSRESSFSYRGIFFARSAFSGTSRLRPLRSWISHMISHDSLRSALGADPAGQDASQRAQGIGGFSPPRGKAIEALRLGRDRGRPKFDRDRGPPEEGETVRLSGRQFHFTCSGRDWRGCCSFTQIHCAMSCALSPALCRCGERQTEAPLSPPPTPPGGVPTRTARTARRWWSAEILREEKPDRSRCFWGDRSGLCLEAKRAGDRCDPAEQKSGKSCGCKSLHLMHGLVGECCAALLQASASAVHVQVQINNETKMVFSQQTILEADFFVFLQDFARLR